MAEDQLPKILIVDDRLDGLMATETILTGLPAELISASSGAEALGCVLGHEIAVVLMETQMAGLDGYATAVAMRANKSMRQTPIIFITEAAADESLEFQGYEAGAVDYLYKPLNPNLLRSKVGVFLSHYRLQCEVREQNAVLERRVAERTVLLQEACHAANSASIAKGEFLANISHEIRTPMTAILGFTEILLGNLKDLENVDAVRTIKNNGEHLLSLINDILDLSKIESGKLEGEQFPCSPHQIIAEVVSLMRVRANAKGLPLQAEYEGCIPEKILTDPTRLRQILINIIGNAIKFTETGSVKIVTRMLEESGDEPRLRIDVIDTGIGIPREKADAIFTPFSQADGSTTRNFGGTGLGLSISKRLAELLGGELAVLSTVGEGSVFSIIVSTGPSHGIRLIRGAGNVTEATDARVTGNRVPSLDGRRVLLAEDGPDSQRLISFILRKAGAEVTLAENGQIASDLALEADSAGRPFDVILMDMQMPVLDGYQATRRLREEGYSQPIVALTAHAMSTDRQKCLDIGCDDYATKPIDRMDLIGMIARYAEPAEAWNAPLAVNRKADSIV